MADNGGSEEQKADGVSAFAEKLTEVEDGGCGEADLPKVDTEFHVQYLHYIVTIDIMYNGYMHVPR